jgi:hypothetical protein
MQDRHMGDIWNIFGDKVRAIIPGKYFSILTKKNA